MNFAVVFILLGAALGGLLDGTLAEPVYENTFCELMHRLYIIYG